MINKCNSLRVNKEPEIESLRGLAIFLVILGHAIIVFPINLHEIFWCKYLYNIIYAFHMPLFFAISGYCFSTRGGGYGAFLIKKAKRLLIPYCVFAIGGIIPRTLLPGVVNGSESIYISVKNVFIHGGEYWFLYTLFIIFAIFPIIGAVAHWRAWPIVLIVTAMRLLSDNVPNMFCLPSVCNFCCFFGFGFLIKQESLLEVVRNKTKKINVKMKLGIVMLSVVSLLFWGYLRIIDNLHFLNVAGGFCGIVVCTMLTFTFPKLFNRFERVGQFSLPLYLLNGYFLVLSRTVIVMVLKISDPLIIISFNVVVDFWISYVLIKHVLSKIPVVRTAIGAN